MGTRSEHAVRRTRMHAHTRMHTHRHTHTHTDTRTRARAHTRSPEGLRRHPSSSPGRVSARPPPARVPRAVAPAGTCTVGTRLVRGPVFVLQSLSYVRHKVRRERAHGRPEGPPAPHTVTTHPPSVASGTVLSCGFGHRSSPGALVTI